MADIQDPETGMIYTDDPQRDWRVALWAVDHAEADDEDAAHVRNAEWRLKERRRLRIAVKALRCSVCGEPPVPHGDNGTLVEHDSNCPMLTPFDTAKDELGGGSWQ